MAWYDRGVAKPSTARKHGKQIAALYGSGVSGVEIARRLGLKRQSVYNALSQLGVHRRRGAPAKRGLNLTKEVLTELYVTQRWTQTRIAERYGVSASVVGRRLKAVGIQSRSGNTTANLGRLSKEHLTQLYVTKKLQLDEVARTIDVSVPTVRRYLHLHGIPLRSRADGAALRLRQPAGTILTRWVSGSGYVMVSVVAESGGTYRIAEHRHVLEVALGRKLRRDESVHHVNGVRTDNRVENLQLRQGAHGVGIVLQCSDCGSGNVRAVDIADA